MNLVIRRALAEWLCPEAFKDQRRYEWLLIKARDAFWWLGEFPEARAALRWVIDNDHDYKRSIGEPDVSLWNARIGDFREQLRRGEHLRAAENNEWQRPAPPSTRREA